jgi:hypothetical protein
LKNVRQRYGHLLANSEYVLLVYDGTWFGSAEDGLILTDRGVGWADTWVTPNYCPYQRLNPDEICDGWTGFYVQGDRRAAVSSADREKVAAALRQSFRDLWKHRV